MSESYAVSVVARDPVSRAGITKQLETRAEVELVDDGQEEVAIVIADRVDHAAELTIRSARRGTNARVVAIISDLDESSALVCIEAGASGLLRRDDADGDHLVGVILAAARGDGALPPDLLGSLFDTLGRGDLAGAHNGPPVSGLGAREGEVLRLVADGFDTYEIAKMLNYSERTIKNVLHDVTTRFGLRNRTHAVAFALREGWI